MQENNQPKETTQEDWSQEEGIVEEIESGYGVDIDEEAIFRAATILQSANPGMFGQLKKNNPELFNKIKDDYNKGQLIHNTNLNLQRHFHAGALTGGNNAKQQ